MDLKELMVISGYPGLYRFVSQGRNAVIVESLEDKKRMSAYSTSRISTLEEIAVFTETGELPLADVFDRVYKHSEGSQVLSHKSADKDIKGFFEEVLPEYDRDRVYVSDMKKIINWYNLLAGYGMLKPASEDKDDSGSPSGEKDSAGAGPDETGSDEKGPDEKGSDGPAAGDKTGTSGQGGSGSDKSGRKKTGSGKNGPEETGGAGNDKSGSK